MHRYKQAAIFALFALLGVVLVTLNQPKPIVSQPVTLVEEPPMPAYEKLVELPVENDMVEAEPVHEAVPDATVPVPAPVQQAGDFPLVTTPPAGFTKPQQKQEKPVFTHPVISIIIDDVGVDQRRSKRAIALPQPVTLSFLPYSNKLTEQVVAAKVAGHELMLHMPMQPEGATKNPGPHVLMVTQTADEIRQAAVNGLDSFSGFVAVNNHMGSKFTQDRAGLEVLMAELKKRNVMFVDSKTSPASIADKVAAEAGVPSTYRDVFIDHSEDKAHVDAALAQLEKIAFNKGSAVAIGHPKDVTLTALEKWLPTLKAKGITVVPVTQIIHQRQK